MANLGFIGLGVMGSEMVLRLLAKGHVVTGFNRTRSKAARLIDAGMKWAGSPREVAAASDFTFSMVTNSAALEMIVEGPDGIIAGLSSGKVLIDMSTVGSEFSRSTRIEKLAGRGQPVLDDRIGFHHRLDVGRNPFALCQ